MLCPAPGRAKDIQTSARQAILLDVDSGTLLFAKDPDTGIDPASLAKLLTLEVMFHKLKTGEVTPGKEYTVSEFAWRTGGAPSGRSTMFAELGSTVPLEALLQAIAVVSANDACLVLAEGEAGSDAGFAQLMNERAKAIGLENSHFANSTGAPAEGQSATLRDLVTLSTHLIHEYPQYYAYFSLPSITWNKIEQRNHNPLIKRKIGVDGIADGFAETSGFMIAASALKSGQRLLVVMAGLENERERATQAEAMLSWGYRNFNKEKLFSGDEIIGEAKVHGGASSTVKLVANRDAEFYLPAETAQLLTLRIEYQGPLKPPVERGSEVARLQLLIGEHVSQEIPLYAAETVAQGSLRRQASDGMKAMIYRMWQKVPVDSMLEEVKTKIPVKN